MATVICFYIEFFLLLYEKHFETLINKNISTHLGFCFQFCKKFSNMLSTLKRYNIMKLVIGKFGNSFIFKMYVIPAENYCSFQGRIQEFWLGRGA